MKLISEEKLEKARKTKVLVLYFGRKSIVVKNPKVIEAVIENVDLTDKKFKVRAK